MLIIKLGNLVEYLYKSILSDRDTLSLLFNL